jgi:ribonuclease P protein component
MERAMRLRETWEIERARSRGVAAASGPLVARVLPNALEPPRNRYAIIAGKRVGKAHERNRCKRVTREALRQINPSIKQGYDVVVIVRGGVSELTGLDVAQRSLLEIFRRAKLLDRESE